MNDYKVCFIDNPFKYVVSIGGDIISMTPSQWVTNCLGITQEEVGIKQDGNATYLVSVYRFGGVDICVKHRFTPSVYKRVLNNTTTMRLLKHDEVLIYTPLYDHIGYSRTGRWHDEFVFFTHTTCENKNTKHIPCPNLDDIVVTTKQAYVVKSFANVKRYVAATHIVGKKITELCSRLHL